MEARKKHSSGWPQLVEPGPMELSSLFACLLASMNCLPCSIYSAEEMRVLLDSDSVEADA